MNPEKTGETAKSAEKIFLYVFCALCGFFFVGISACGAQKVASKPPVRNLVLITVDTLRADHVGAYGWARARTPALDGIATNGAVFERAFAAAPITLPSHATLLTGAYSDGHGIFANEWWDAARKRQVTSVEDDATRLLGGTAGATGA